MALTFIHTFAGQALHRALDLGQMQVLGVLMSFLPVIVLTS